jgi:hypothetical protein
VQLLFTHACPIAQAVPQPPQLVGSLAVFTHRVPHWVSVQVALHVPLVQKSAVAGHAMPQPPQFARSLEMSVQTLPQLV